MHPASKKEYAAASRKYGEAVGILDGLCTMEKPGDPEYIAIDCRKIPFYLNHAQCQLLLGNYYDVITYADEVLSRDSNNVKAIFRRAKASAALGDFSAARLGFTLAERLTPDLASVVRRELDALAFDIETKTAEEKQCYSKLFK